MSLTKLRIEDVESYKTQSRGHWVLWNIKQRVLSHMKHKGEDVESDENIKTKDVESYET